MAIFGLNNYTKSNAGSEVGRQGLGILTERNQIKVWNSNNFISGSKSRTIPNNWPRSQAKPAEGLGAAGWSRAQSGEEVTDRA